MSLDKSTRHNRIREALDRIYDQHPPQVREYLRRYQEDPKSRVFAPLAEAYRRLGRIDEAVGLCLEGLENHPEFHGGRVALAKCYIDKSQFDKAAKELEKVVQNIPENLLAQRLLGDCLMALGQAHQALHCYKMAAMLAPNDVQLEEKVRLIEASVKSAPETSGVHSTTQTVVLNPPAAPKKGGSPPPVETTVPSMWEMDVSDLQAPTQSQVARQEGATLLSSPVSVDETVSWLNEDVEDDFVEKAPDSKPIEEALSPSGIDLEESFQVQSVTDLFRDEASSAEITTTTLADLYFSQGQFEKSLLICEKLLEKNPGSTPLQQKIARCRSQLGVRAESETVDKKIELLQSVLKRNKIGDSTL
ncbi:MAG: tetratricopeptide repeat protein [Deltaproteobacteria bacterium]|nr:tetratricopeptide repeat protein [Deltaproteobacteria bacterium]MBI3294357.1 tetratricopeptide repeat protein [Deltaproteobacteria bacterium]